MSSNLSLCVKINLSNILVRTKSVRSFSGISLLPTLWNSNNILQSGSLLHTSFENAAFLNKVKLLCPSFLCLRSNSKLISSHNVSKYFNKSGSVSLSSAASTEPLTKIQAQDLILRLTDEERRALLSALQEFQSEKMKAEYEGQLAGTRWRSKFGRPSKLPHLGDVDPTGSYCPVPEDWLMRKYAENVPLPTARDLWKVCVHNSVPFIGFGFLDNFFMILAGDYIEYSIGTVVVISTMAAAALGNTISDILGLGSAWYVERMAIRVGMKPPKLSPIQLDMPISRRFANLGRVLGVTIGCLLGMLPLLFLSKKLTNAEPQDDKE